MWKHIRRHDKWMDAVQHVGHLSLATVSADRLQASYIFGAAGFAFLC